MQADGGSEGLFAVRAKEEFPLLDQLGFGDERLGPLFPRLQSGRGRADGRFRRKKRLNVRVRRTRIRISFNNDTLADIIVVLRRNIVIVVVVVVVVGVLVVIVVVIIVVTIFVEHEGDGVIEGIHFDQSNLLSRLFLL